MKNLERWESLEKEIETLSKEETQLGGEKKYHIEQLTKLGFKSVAEAEKEADKKEEEISSLEEETDILIEDVEDGLAQVKRALEEE